MGADAALVHESAGSNVLLTRTFSQGDVAAAFRDAALVVGDRFRFHRHAGVTMESRACLADTESGTLTLWSSTQIPGIQIGRASCRERVWIWVVDATHREG